MKTEQTAIVYALWNRWASSDVLKDLMITTDAIIRIALKAMRNPFC